MTTYSKHLFFIIVATFSINTLYSNNIYQQINPELLKKINLENPSVSDQQLITACQMTEQFGSAEVGASNIVWQAITSVEMITEVLPRLTRTNTTFGYIALAQKCAQMSADISTLKKKTDLMHYFENHEETFTKLNRIVKNSDSGEAKFLELCTKHNEEEQLSQDNVNKKLYYNTKLGSYLNENSLALGFWTRINQLNTLTWYIFPTLWYANMTQKVNPYIKNEIELFNKNFDLTYNRNLTPEQEQKVLNDIKTLQEYIKNNPTCAHKAYDDFANNLKKIDIAKQTDVEKCILQSSVIDFLPNIFNLWEKHKIEIIKHIAWFSHYLTKHFVIDGITNAPAFYSDIIIGTTNFIKDQYTNQPIYHYFKDNVTPNSWSQDAIKTKALATTLTATTYLGIAGMSAIYPMILYNRYKSTKELFDLVYEKQCDLVQVSHLIRSMQRTNNVILKNRTLSSLIPESLLLEKLFDTSNSKISTDLNNLIQTVLSSSFTDEAYYLSQQGKILATHHLLMRVKHELIPYLQAFGQIDAALSIYKLYVEFQNHPTARICIPEFIQQEKPQITIQDFWHPLINPNTVITNSLALGTTNQDTNLIITGPNAGGKTTSLLSLIINIIMAQSFGIAPSAHLSLTPFTKIHSYLDITTNLIEGESLFKAEVNRAKKLKESILSCSSNEKTFTIIDEIFSGTNPDVASSVGYTFADQLGQIDHSMAIITTHFPRLTDLESQTSHYTNYKVADATIAQDGTVSYPFKLEKGKSSQNIAQHMLEHEGII